MKFKNNDLEYEAIWQSLNKLEKWIEHNEYKGYDPADGLTSYLRPLTFGNLFLDRILLQSVQRSPVNLRPILGVKPQDSFIGRGYMALGYLSIFKMTGNSDYKEKSILCLEWLKANKAPTYTHYSWGKFFDFASRAGLYKAFEPILIWTALIGHAFLEAFETLADGACLNVAESICEWIMRLPRNHTDSGFCIGYHNHDAMGTIHNSNMAGAAVLARTYKHNRNREYAAVAKEAMTYSCTRQLPNGAWWYGEAPTYHWIDNFHTGYNLDALKCYIESSGDISYDNNLRKGFEFYIDNFFETTGKPKYYYNKIYPIDSQCAAQAIETLSNFAEYDSTSLKLSFKIVKWTIKHMQDKDGYFYFRQYPLIRLKIPMIHWAQATTYRALALFLSKLALSHR